jgi:hypothetical protein
MNNGLVKKSQLLMPLVSGLLFRCLTHLFSSPFFWGKKMIITRGWAMPNHNTFSIKPIGILIDKYLTDGKWLDPFSRNSPYKNKTITNDLSTDFEADYHLEALEFLKQFDDNSVDGVLFDPPYSPRQISECYKNVGREVHMKDTQSSFYTERKKEVARIVKSGGTVISFGWNSGGIGKTLGFELQEILLVAHGGAHNDTICCVEIKNEMV